MKIASRYKKFLIKPDDHFDDMNYLQLQDHLETIKTETTNLPLQLRSDMVIAFVKDGFIKNEWKETSPLLTEFLNSKNPALEYLAELFDSCSGNEIYRLQLETYIRKMLD